MVCSGTALLLLYPIFVIFNSTYSEMKNYHSICSNINFIEMCTNYYRVTYCYKFAPATACIWQNFYLQPDKIRSPVLKFVRCIYIYIPPPPTIELVFMRLQFRAGSRDRNLLGILTCWSQGDKGKLLLVDPRPCTSWARGKISFWPWVDFLSGIQIKLVARERPTKNCKAVP
jgi:hypothetical protein